MSSGRSLPQINLGVQGEIQRNSHKFYFLLSIFTTRLKIVLKNANLTWSCLSERDLNANQGDQKERPFKCPLASRDRQINEPPLQNWSGGIPKLCFMRLRLGHDLATFEQLCCIF
ncbi:hypothetical protein TNCV_1524451 [Trichonephila clavipes]|nr:hypothetical protein TNCV_1524451 [Trichonephila clavipes]